MAVPTAPEPALQVFAQPAEQPEPATFVVPLAITAGPGFTYLSTLEWMLIWIPGSLLFNAPGSLTPAGRAAALAEPPATLIW